MKKLGMWSWTELKDILGSHMCAIFHPWVSVASYIK